MFGSSVSVGPTAFSRWLASLGAGPPPLGDALASSGPEMGNFSFRAQVRVLESTSVLVGLLDFSGA